MIIDHLMESPHFLHVPDDPILRVSSPPCSPIPEGWEQNVEEAPYQAPDVFDQRYGEVQLGDGSTLFLGERHEGRWKVIAKGAIIATRSSLPFDGRDSTISLPENGGSRRVGPERAGVKTCPPTIVVETYNEQQGYAM